MSLVIEITGLHDPLLQIYSNLTQGDPSQAGPAFLAESEKVIEYALAAGCRPISFLMERQAIENSAVISRWNDVPVYTGSRETIRRLTGYALSRGFLCAMERPAPRPEEKVVAGASRLAVLRNISDPADLGAIFRSAAALGVDGILIGEGCCDPLYRRTVRVSMGTVFQVPWAFHRQPLAPDFQTIVVSLSPSGVPLDADCWRCCEKLAVIVDPDAGRDSFSIPQHPATEPLNLAAASAVLFWMLRKA